MPARPHLPGLRSVRPSRLVLASVVASILTVAALASGCTHPRTSTAVTIPGGGTGARATVIHVVDGDTVDLEIAGGGTERARLLGIDTPETVKPNTPVQCFGPEASARTKALLAPGRAVLVQRDREARDKYGRLLVYLWRASDGLFINRSLVDDGYARILSIEPNTAHRADLAAALSAARAANKGLWATCPPPG